MSVTYQADTDIPVATRPPVPDRAVTGDPLGAARGIFNGAILSTIFWIVALIGAWRLLRG